MGYNVAELYGIVILIFKMPQNAQEILNLITMSLKKTRES